MKYLNCFLLILFGQLLLFQTHALEEDIKALVKSSKIRKCDCEADQIYDAGNCVNYDNGTVVLLELFQGHIIPVKTNYFEVIPNPLNCKHGEVPTLLSGNDFVFLDTGELFSLTFNKAFSFLEYCINHVPFDDETLPFDVEVQLCLEPPKISVCCLNTDGTVQNQKSGCHNLDVPISFGESFLKKPFIKDDQIGSIQCLENFELKTHVINKVPKLGLDTYIAYNGNSVILVPNKNEISPIFIPVNDFCVRPSAIVKGTYEALFCEENPIIALQNLCKNLTCVRKCCPEAQIYDRDLRACRSVFNSSHLWEPNFHDIENNTIIPEPENTTIIHGFPICKSFYEAQKSERRDKPVLSKNGSVYTSYDETFISSPRYCMDNFLRADEEFPSESVVVCFPDNPREKSVCEKVKKVLLPVCLSVSCFFLLITLMVYSTIPELHAKLHGKSLISHVLALFTAYLSLIIVTVNSSSMPFSVCKIFAFIMQCSFLAAFFWLNVMCFDIWWTLRSMRPVAETSESSRRRFVFYSIYAWGCPLIIMAVTIGMQTLSPEEYPNLILPGVGHTDCWLAPGFPIWFYFYFFISVLTAVDLFFFSCVAIILIQAQRANDSILKTSSKQHKERVWIYLKLFVVMGITWICEIVSWKEGGTCEYWFLTDIINSLQGFFIFLIFICKKNIFAKVRTRGTASTRMLKRMVQGSSSYGSSSQVSQQTSLDSSRKLSTSLQYHLSKFTKDNNITEESPKKTNS